MTKRLKEICSLIPPSKCFADIGCDHGYCARFVLERGLADRVYITDISAKSLQKAVTLLKDEIAAGRCIPLVGDGLKPLNEPCTVLIAGLGGEEIVKILSEKMPPRFILQPMKNTDKVRRFLIANGCRVTHDYTFEDGKYYDLLAGESGKEDFYTEREFVYGRDNLKNPSRAFLKKLKEDILKTQEYLKASKSASERERLHVTLLEKEEILHEIEGNL